MNYPKEFEIIDKYTDRLKIFGGWLVRSTTRSGFPAIHTVFVKDQNHLWVLENKSNES